MGLANLFGVELWERFSFYGMLTILGYYLYYSATDGGLGMNRATATGIVGAYGGLVYLSTVLGGWISDRLLGMERTVFYGGVVVVAGHIALGLLPGFTGVTVGLTLVALGSGALKANASALLGTLYAEDDPRRAAGFTLFYLGVNIGAFLGPLLTGVLQTRLGFHYGFGAAAIGMALGLTQYAVFRRNLGEHGRVAPNPLPRSQFGIVAAVVAGIVGLVAAALGFGVVRASNLSTVTSWSIGVVAAGYFALILTSSRVTPVERARVRAFLPLFVANAVFWSLFQQMFTVLAVYSDKRMNWTLFGWTAPSSWIGSEEPVWVIVLSPLFAALWTRLGNRAPTTPRKFAYGVIGMGAAFLLFVPLAGLARVPALLVFVILGVFAVSELLLSPTGLAVTTQLAPNAFRAQMMALYFLSVALGTALSGVFAGYYDTDREPAYFATLGLAAITVGILTAIMSPWVSRHMPGVH
ncbi:peptide MFS transporter [Nocardia stercoris]|uniref:MFS transporter n=1 Tax=Nocardia stercoris TaxID=2483361 RepID=A0A3M2LI46_9NOCA|nr:MFS transporter [Nocardia stercoris]